MRRLTRVQSEGTENVDLAYSGLGARVAQERRYSAIRVRYFREKTRANDC